MLFTAQVSTRTLAEAVAGTHSHRQGEEYQTWRGCWRSQGAGFEEQSAARDIFYVVDVQYRMMIDRNIRPPSSAAKDPRLGVLDRWVDLSIQAKEPLWAERFRVWVHLLIVTYSPARRIRNSPVSTERDGPTRCFPTALSPRE